MLFDASCCAEYRRNNITVCFVVYKMYVHEMHVNNRYMLYYFCFARSVIQHHVASALAPVIEVGMAFADPAMLLAISPLMARVSVTFSV